MRVSNIGKDHEISIWWPLETALSLQVETPLQVAAEALQKKKTRRIQNLVWKTVIHMTCVRKCVMLKTNYILLICKSISASNFHIMKSSLE